MKTLVQLSSAEGLLACLVPCLTTGAVRRFSIARWSDGRKSTRHEGWNAPGASKNPPGRQLKISTENQLCTEADEILLKGSAETQHDNWQLLHPVRVVFETAIREAFMVQ